MITIHPSLVAQLGLKATFEDLRKKMGMDALPGVWVVRELCHPVTHMCNQPKTKKTKRGTQPNSYPTPS